MKRCDFIKIVQHHFPTWEVIQGTSEYIRFVENGTDMGGVTSYSPYTNRIHTDKNGNHIAMFIAHYSVAGLKALGYINGIGVHE